LSTPTRSALSLTIATAQSAVANLHDSVFTSALLTSARSFAGAIAFVTCQAHS
jgi:hypothetical protein